VKRCTKCGESKARSEFHCDTRLRDGLRSKCKTCQGAAKASYLAKPENRESARLYSENRRLNHPELYRASKEKQRARPDYKAMQRAAQKKYAAANPEKIRAKNARRSPEAERERMRTWRLANIEKARARERAARRAHPERTAKSHAKWLAARGQKWWRAYYAANRAQFAAHSALRRARKRGASEKDLSKIKAFYKWVREAEKITCYLCGKLVPKSLREVDHVSALAAGGSHTVENLRCACRRCNRSKHVKDAEVFRTKLLRHSVDPHVQS